MWVVEALMISLVVVSAALYIIVVMIIAYRYRRARSSPCFSDKSDEEWQAAPVKRLVVYEGRAITAKEAKRLRSKSQIPSPPTERPKPPVPLSSKTITVYDTSPAIPNSKRASPPYLDVTSLDQSSWYDDHHRSSASLPRLIRPNKEIKSARKNDSARGVFNITLAGREVLSQGTHNAGAPTGKRKRPRGSVISEEAQAALNNMPASQSCPQNRPFQMFSAAQTPPAVTRTTMSEVGQSKASNGLAAQRERRQRHASAPAGKALPAPPHPVLAKPGRRRSTRASFKVPPPGRERLSASLPKLPGTIAERRRADERPTRPGSQLRPIRTRPFRAENDTGIVADPSFELSRQSTGAGAETTVYSIPDPAAARSTMISMLSPPPIPTVDSAASRRASGHSNQLRDAWISSSSSPEKPPFREVGDDASPFKEHARRILARLSRDNDKAKRPIANSGISLYSGC